ncbi:MAG: ribosome recycling factor [Candidatus Andersenbacteria bacterium]
MTLADAETTMRDALAHFKDELAKLRTGRAQPGLVEDLPVEAYGTMQPLKGLASVAVPEPRQLLISPWDKSTIKAIEKAIQESDLGLNPTVTGTAIRLTLPELTAERREELTKVVKTKAEETRVGLRTAREAFLKAVKADVDAGTVGEDALERGKKQVQDLIDKMNAEVEQLVAQKSTQLTTI